MDFAPALKQGNDLFNILICMEDLSKFVLLDIFPDCHSAMVSNWYLCTILGPYGCPLQIRTDGSPEFTKEFHALLTGFGIRHVITCLHAPWTNGCTERMVH